MKNMWYAVVISMSLGSLVGMENQNIPANIIEALELANKHYQFFQGSYSVIYMLKKDSCRFEVLRDIVCTIAAEVSGQDISVKEMQDRIRRSLQRASVQVSEIHNASKKGDDEQLYTLSLMLPANGYSIKKILCTIRKIKKDGNEWGVKELCTVIDNVIRETRPDGGYIDQFGTHHSHDYSEDDEMFFKIPYLTARPIEGIAQSTLNTCTRIEWCKQDSDRMLCVLEHPEYAHINNGKLALLLNYNKEKDCWQAPVGRIRRITHVCKIAPPQQKESNKKESS